jgi:CHAT domain-containing protein/uncharacterized protein HemY
MLGKKFCRYYVLFWLLLMGSTVVAQQSIPKTIEELAAALLAAKSEQERTVLLDSNKDLVSAELFNAVFQQGRKFSDRQQWQQSFNAYEIARQIAERINSKPSVAKALLEIGNDYFDQHQFDKALGYFQQSLALRKEADDKDGIASSLRHIAKVYRVRGDYSGAIAHLQQAVALLSEVKSKSIAAGVLIELANNELSIGDLTSSLTHAQQALKLYEEIDQKQGIIATRLTTAAILVRLGEYDSALENLNQALALAESQNIKPYMISALNNIGATYGERGNYGKAIEFLEKSLQLTGDRGISTKTLNNIGLLHYKQNNYAQALNVLQRGLALSESRGTKADAATTLNIICAVYGSQRNYEKAIEYCQKSVKLNEETKSDSLIAESLNTLGSVYEKQGKIALAIETFLKCLDIFQKSGGKEDIGNTLSNLASAYLKDNKPAKALRHAEQAIEIAKRSGRTENLYLRYNNLGEAYLALNRTSEARAAFIESVAALETLRSESLSGEIQQQNFLEGRTSPYQYLVALSVKQNEPVEALRYAEQMKARLLLDVLYSGRVQIAKAMTQEEKEQERIIKNELVSLNSQIFNEQAQDKPDQARLATLNQQLEKARLKQQDFQTKLYAAHPDLKLQRGQTAPFSLEQSAVLLSDNQTALLEYVLTNDKAFLFVITRDRQDKPNLKVYELAAKSEEINNLARKYRELLATRNVLFRETAWQLYDLIFKPAQAELRGKIKLVIVPDDALWELPFQALVNEKKRYLIEDYSISFAPSLTVLAQMKKKRQQKRNSEAPTLLAFGNPNLGKEQISSSLFKTRTGDFAPLPETETEVKKLVELYGKERSLAFTGSAARESELKMKAGNYKVLHLATHSILNDASPMYSQIVLSQENATESNEDGLLEAWEILQLDLKSDLVVLSACETARGRVSEGEGMIGLSWALFVAGAPTIVVSQWKVDSTITSDLMLEFHRNLQTNGTKASLRKAMLKLTQSKQYNHPFYWAAFVVVGDGN